MPNWAKDYREAMEKYEMMERLKGGARAVSSGLLGSNCWSAIRFTGGQRCQRWDICDYPEKQTCKAREAEIKYHEGLIGRQGTANQK